MKTEGKLSLTRCWRAATAMVVLFAGLLGGCGHREGAAAHKHRTNSVEEATIRVGQRTQDGALVIHVFEEGGGLRIPVRVYDDYAYMVHNVGDEQHPKAKFELALNKESRVMEFATLAEFQTALGALPRGATLYQYDKCAASTARGLDSRILEDIESFGASRGITVTNANFVTCICTEAP